MFGALITSMALIAILSIGTWYRSEKLDRTYIISMSIGVVLLWLVPLGILILIPLGIFVSLLSPAGRLEWTEFRNRRLLVALSMLIILLLTSLQPVAEPIGSSEWGNPIATENPHAASWPASEQYTWIHDGAVIGLLSTRTPHTFSPYLQAQSTLEMGIMLGMHEARMRQSIELIPGSPIDSNQFFLEEISTEGTHNYGDTELHVRKFVVKHEGFETPLAEVLVVAFTSFGGELDILTITRPSFPSHADVFEEDIVLQYIEVRE
ncbi:MAG: hypothetical protein QGI21_07425 [Candidatus Poseidoniaceae archaeon]|nr:hypothetical protein [Candidatus Poseidoniaceae archaeon]